jgi:hypothetical protein
MSFDNGMPYSYNFLIPAVLLKPCGNQINEGRNPLRVIAIKNIL